MRGLGPADGASCASFSEVDALFELGDRLVIEQAFDDCVVGFLDPETRVGQAVSEFTIIREQDQTGGIEVEPTHGVEAGTGGVVHQIKHGAPNGTGLILHGADRAGGLVEHDVDVSLGRGHMAAIDLDAVGFWINQDRECAHDGAVDADPALLNEQFAGASRGKACIGHDPLESDQAVEVRIGRFLVSCRPSCLCARGSTTGLCSARGSGLGRIALSRGVGRGPACHAPVYAHAVGCPFLPIRKGECR